MLARLATRAAAVLNRLVPPTCTICARGLEAGRPPVCSLCWHRLPAIPRPFCRRCGAAWTAHPSPAAAVVGGERCPECEGWPDGLERAAAPYLMHGAAAELVRRLKYTGWRMLAAPMGASMGAPAVRILPPGGDPILVPVPLAAARLRERGFNQAALLARTLGRSRGWEVRELLVRRRTGRRQVGLGKTQRLTNVADLFGLGPESVGSAVREPDTRPLLLVDDVLTTGATAAACSSVLREAGLRCAGVVTFARALRPLGGR